jgi:hypothetical protein
MLKRVTGVFRNAYARASESYDQQYIEETNSRKRRRVEEEEEGDQDQESQQESEHSTVEKKNKKSAAVNKVVEGVSSESLQEKLGDATAKIAELQSRIEELEYELVLKDALIKKLENKVDSDDDEDQEDNNENEDADADTEDSGSNGDDQDLENGRSDNIADKSKSPNVTLVSKEGDKLKELEILSPIKPKY